MEEETLPSLGSPAPDLPQLFHSLPIAEVNTTCVVVLRVQGVYLHAFDGLCQLPHSQQTLQRTTTPKLKWTQLHVAPKKTKEHTTKETKKQSNNWMCKPTGAQWGRSRHPG